MSQNAKSACSGKDNHYTTPSKIQLIDGDAGIILFCPMTIDDTGL
jgi:hypothetical protein